MGKEGTWTATPGSFGFRPVSGLVFRVEGLASLEGLAVEADLVLLLEVFGFREP